MRRIIAIALAGFGLLAGFGCNRNAEYVQKNKDGGIIALKVSADETEARKLMEKHLGDNYEVVEKYDPRSRDLSGKTDPMGQTPPSMGMFGPKNESVVHIAYRKRSDGGTGKTPVGLPPAPLDIPLEPAGHSGQPSAINPPTLFGQ